MPHSNDLCYQFGPYQLDVSNRILTRHGEVISLTPKATEILIMLVKHAGQLVEKDELLTMIWADTFVEEANLTQNIFLLRRALGDERAGHRDAVPYVPERLSAASASPIREGNRQNGDWQQAGFRHRDYQGTGSRTRPHRKAHRLHVGR